MEIKTWNEYSKEEKITLLKHWWYYYGKMIVTLAECEQFDALIESDSDRMFKLAVDCYINGYSTKSLIHAMRLGTVEKMFEILETASKEQDEEYKQDLAKGEPEFIAMLVNSYNHPEPSIPMDPVEITLQVLEIGRKRTLKKDNKNNKNTQ